MGAWRDPGAALVYFSFITLTTVGYGDIGARVAGCRGGACSGGGRRRPTLSRDNDRPAGRLAHLAAHLMRGDNAGRGSGTPGDIPVVAGRCAARRRGAVVGLYVARQPGHRMARKTPEVAHNGKTSMPSPASIDLLNASRGTQYF